MRQQHTSTHLILKLCGLVGVFLLLTPNFAWCAEGHHAAEFSSLTWPAVNFVLYVVVMVYVYRRFAAPALRARSHHVAEHFRKSAQDLLVAQQAIQEAQDRLDGIEAEKQEIVMQMLEEGQQLAQLILEGAEKREQEIAEATERRIASEHKIAIREVRENAIRIATQSARESLQKTVTQDRDRQLRQQVLANFASEQA